MELEGSYDKAFIDEELLALQTFFEFFGDISDEKAVDHIVSKSAREICSHHQRLVDCDMDSVVEMMAELFLRPLKTILPPKLDLGAMIWTKFDEKKSLIMNMKMISQPEINAFVKHAVANPDSRVAILGDRIYGHWLVIIRQEKDNIYDKKLLK